MWQTLIRFFICINIGERRRWRVAADCESRRTVNPLPEALWVRVPLPLLIEERQRWRAAAGGKPVVLWPKTL